MSQLNILKALADDSRLRILGLLSEQPLCVCELEALLGLLQSNVSRHLNKLTTSQLVTYSKRNKYIYYEINKEWLGSHAPFVMVMLDYEKAANHQIRQDLSRLAQYKSGADNLGDEALQKLCWNMSGKSCCAIEEA